MTEYSNIGWEWYQIVRAVTFGVAALCVGAGLSIIHARRNV